MKQQYFFKRLAKPVKPYWQAQRSRFSQSKSMAKARNLDWDLTLNQYYCLIKQTCFYCNERIQKTGYGLDRKDSLKGYTKENVVPCCGDCNKHRHISWTVDEMKIAIEAIKNHRRFHVFI